MSIRIMSQLALLILCFMVQGASTPVEDDHRSLAERRHRRESRLPQRFHDISLQPLLLLPPTPDIGVQRELTAPSPPNPLPPTSSSQMPIDQPLGPRILQTFCMPRNVFGLSRR